jgi:hypothetical protein
VRSDFGEEGTDTPLATEQAGSDGYEAPTVVVLGTFAELTQQGVGAADELNFDGSQI